MSLVAVVLLRAVDHLAAVALLLRAVAAVVAAAVVDKDVVQVLLLLALWLRSPLFGGLFLRLRFNCVFLELYYIIRGVHSELYYCKKSGEIQKLEIRNTKLGQNVAC